MGWENQVDTIEDGIKSYSGREGIWSFEITQNGTSSII
jgi:hypothetical protein